MAKEIDAKKYKALVAEVKKNPGMSETHYVEASGIPRSQILAALVKAEVEADPSLKIKPTGAAIVAAREKEGLRWPRIAARTGLTVSDVKAKFEEHSGKSAGESYTGRGRNFSGNGSGTKAASRKAASAGRKSGGAGRGTSGRRAAKSTTAKSASAGKTTKSAPAGRRRTRADRKVASGDPQ